MPRRQSATLTEAELRIMEVLWNRRSGTVQQVLEALPEKPSLAYNSVLTIIRILEKKGYVEHEKDGRAHVYAPLIEREFGCPNARAWLSIERSLFTEHAPSPVPRWPCIRYARW